MVEINITGRTWHELEINASLTDGIQRLQMYLYVGLIQIQVLIYFDSVFDINSLGSFSDYL